MKKILFTLLVAAGLSVSARALVTTGADVGYLFDSKEAYYTGRVGLELNHSLTLSHQLEVEVGYTKSEESGADGSLLPVTLNYRLQGDMADGWGYYAGLGAGVARTRVDGVSINGPVRLHDTSFAAQAFAGVEYRFTPAAAATVGLRYIWIDDVKLAGTRFEIGDDVAVSAGLSFKF